MLPQELLRESREPTVYQKYHSLRRSGTPIRHETYYPIPVSDVEVLRLRSLENLSTGWMAWYDGQYRPGDGIRKLKWAHLVHRWEYYNDIAI